MYYFPLTTIISQMNDKGYLWEFKLPSCTTLHAIKRVTVVANGEDGWNIESIVTLARDSDDKIQLLTQDLGVNRWIDTNDGPEDINFMLTLSNSVSSGIGWYL